MCPGRVRGCSFDLRSGGLAGRCSELYGGVPYCESVITGTSYSVSALGYRSQGSISQADDLMPGSPWFVILSNGSGTFLTRSGTTAVPSGDLGYMNGMSEPLAVGGRSDLDGRVQRS